MLFLLLTDSKMREVSPLPAGGPKPWLKTQRLGEWRLLDDIGSGGCGDVFLAENRDGDRRALKVFYPDVDDRRAFDLEYNGMDISRQMSTHPNVLPIESVGRTEHCIYYTMPLADPLGSGHYEPYTLYNRIRRDNLTGKDELTEAELLELADAMLNALEFIHGKELIHRDVKPDNIMRVEGVWRLGDLGLISRLRPRDFAGTPGFYPKGKKLRAGTSGDIYALGKTLYCAATGMKPTCYPLVPKKYDYDRCPLLRNIYRKAIEGEYRSASNMKRDVASALDQLL